MHFVSDESVLRSITGPPGPPGPRGEKGERGDSSYILQTTHERSHGQSSDRGYSQNGERRYHLDSERRQGQNGNTGYGYNERWLETADYSNMALKVAEYIKSKYLLESADPFPGLLGRGLKMISTSRPGSTAGPDSRQSWAGAMGCPGSPRPPWPTWRSRI